MREEYLEAKDVKALTNLLLKQDDAPQPVLIRAEPGTGKTWSAKQLAYFAATDPQTECADDAGRLVPIIIYVQQLARLLRASSDASAHPVEEFIRATYSNDHPEWAAMLSQAFDMRTLLIVLDGVDEAAELKESVERFVLDELVAHGHRVLVTSRPEGVRIELYNDFVVVDLKPLSHEQQRAVIEQQLEHNEVMDHLLAVSNIRQEHDRVFEKAFSSDERGRVQQLRVRDRFKLASGEYDPAQRQTASTGRRCARQPTMWSARARRLISRSICRSLIVCSVRATC